MPLPDRPVEGAEIATEWGQEIHDRVFAPSGCEVHSSSAGNVGTSLSQVNLDVADNDPGGFLVAASDLVEIPTDRGGLYVVYVRGNTVGGSAGDGFQTRFQLWLNGSQVSAGIEDNAAGTNVPVPVFWVGVLSAGDQLKVYAQRKGAGTNPNVSVISFVLLRIGAELGA